MKAKHGFFYGWVIVACGVIITALTVGMVTNTTSLFLIPMCESLGYSRAEMSITQTLRLVGSMVVSLIGGFLFKRYKMHMLLKLCTVGFVASALLYACTSNIFVLYLLAFLVSAFLTMISFLAFSIIIPNWFHQKSGLALGITYTGSGLGGMIFCSLFAEMIRTIGWQKTLLVQGIIAGVVLIPVVFFLLRVHPGDMGLQPYGEGDVVARQQQVYGPGVRGVLRSRNFYLVIPGLLGVGIVCNAIGLSQTAYLQDIGYSITESASFASLYMATLIGTKIGIGAFADKFGLRWVLILVLVSLMLGIAALLLSENLIIALLGILFMGIYESMTSVTVPLICSTTLGTKDFGALSGMAFAAMYTGGAIGPLFINIVYDSVGSYKPAYMVFWAISALCMFAIIRAAAKPVRPANIQ